MCFSHILVSDEGPRIIIRFRPKTFKKLDSKLNLTTMRELHKSKPKGVSRRSAIQSFLASAAAFPIAAHARGVELDENELADKIGHDWKNPETYDANDGSVVDW